MLCARPPRPPRYLVIGGVGGLHDLSSQIQPDMPRFRARTPADAFARSNVRHATPAAAACSCWRIDAVLKNRYELGVEVLRALDHCSHESGGNGRCAKPIHQGVGFLFGVSVEGVAQSV